MLIPLGDDLEKRSLPFTAMGLIAVCTLIFVYEFRLQLEGTRTGEPLIEDFVRTWALIPATLPEGDFLKLGTHAFLHADWMHLIGNMLMLWVFSASLEQGLGAVRFLIVYLVAGISGGVLHAIMNSGETVPMLGASGAIFGVIGAYVVAFGAMANMSALLIMGPVRQKISMPAGAYVFFWVLIEQMLGMMVEEEFGGTGTAWYAHAGGFAAGAVSMLFLKDYVKSRMVMNRDGALEFTAGRRNNSYDPVKHGQTSPAAVSMEDDFPQVPSECPHCHTAVTEDNRLADELYRCPNPNCKRLVYPTKLATVGGRA